MEENQLQISPSGLRFRTREENVLAWRASFTNVLTKYGHVLLQSTQTENSYHQSFEKGDSKLVADWYKDGLVEISTSDVDELFESVIPHFEIRVNVKFQCEPVQFELFPTYMVYFLANRDQNTEENHERSLGARDMEKKRKITLDDLPNKNNEEQLDVTGARRGSVADRARRKSIAIIEEAKQKPTGLIDLDRYAYEIEAERNRRASVSEVARQRNLEIIAEVKQKTSELSPSDEYTCEISRPFYLVDNVDSPYVKMQNELSDARSKLATTENKLDSITKKLSRASLNDHYSCKGYQRCCFESFCPLYNHNYKYGYKYGSGIVDSRDYGYTGDVPLDQGKEVKE